MPQTMLWALLNTKGWNAITQIWKMINYFTLGIVIQSYAVRDDRFIAPGFIPGTGINNKETSARILIVSKIFIGGWAIMLP